MSTTNSGLVTRVDERIMSLVLDRPDRGNALRRAVQHALVEGFALASSSPDSGAVVLTATGDRHFCTGADLGDPDLRPSQERAAGDAARMLREGGQRVVAAILDCEKPVVCALNGVAAGAGASLMLACDLVVAAEHARIIEVFVRRGLAPDGGAAYLLARRLPLNVAKELVFFGDELSASDAHRLGLVNRVVPRAELETVVLEWTRRLADGPTRAIAAAKAMLNHSLDAGRPEAFTTEALLVEQVAATQDVAEGVAAFLERRAPRFTGR
jgi:2-(1,2-epoxy-1,2-dihydrophenyl)acetyl-CoA isomerase